MNKVFSPGRFGKYFLYDLNCAKNNFLLSLLILAFLPEMLFALASLISIIFGFTSTNFLLSMRYSALVGGVIAVLFTFAAKVYGSITEKRYGSDWLLIPASPFEKWLSMGLVTCVVLPAVYFSINLGADALMCKLFPETYGPLLDVSSLVSKVDASGLHLNFSLFFWLKWCENILLFTIGALVFKKNKIGKTILVCFAIGMLISSIASLIVSGTFSFDASALQNYIERIAEKGPEALMTRFNIFTNVVYTFVFAVLLGGLYLRIKTIKH